MSHYDYDVIVIGTGVAGQTVAEELATAGKRVLVIDRREFGGTCALRGCEPKKALYAVAEAAERARAQSGNGLIGEVSVDWAQLIDFKRTFTDSASASIEGAITGMGAEALHGTARFRDADTIEVDGRPLHRRAHRDRDRRDAAATRASPAPNSCSRASSS